MSADEQEEQETRGVNRQSGAEMSKNFVFKCNEDLFDNFLDKSVQKTFRPFHAIQWLFLMPKYKVCENFMYYNSPLTDFLSIFSTVAVTAFSIYHGTMILFKAKSNTLAKVLPVTDVVFYSMGFVISYSLNLSYRQINTELVLNFQKMSNMIKFQKNKEFHLFVTFSWIGLAALLVYYAVFSVIATIIYGLDISNIIRIVTAVHFDMNIIYASRIIILIENYLNSWISELNSIIKMSTTSDTNNDITITCMDNIAVADEQELEHIRQEIIKNEWMRLFQLYKKNLETYDLYKKAFQILILYHSVKAFVYALLYVHQMFVSTEYSNMKYNYLMGTGLVVTIWILKDMALQLIISFACESFYDKIDSARAVCLNVINNKDSQEIARRICKNILRLTKVSFEKMLLCRLYVVDAGMPLILINNVVNYIILIIQFAFSKEHG